MSIQYKDMEASMALMRNSGTATLERGGVTYVGDWSLANNMLTVKLRGGGTKPAQLGGSTPESLASVLLSELVTEHLRKK
jgi:hypothetical protein